MQPRMSLWLLKREELLAPVSLVLARALALALSGQQHVALLHCGLNFSNEYDFANLDRDSPTLHRVQLKRFESPRALAEALMWLGRAEDPPQKVIVAGLFRVLRGAHNSTVAMSALNGLLFAVRAARGCFYAASELFFLDDVLPGGEEGSRALKHSYVLLFCLKGAGVLFMEETPVRAWKKVVLASDATGAPALLYVDFSDKLTREVALKLPVVPVLSDPEELSQSDCSE